MEKHPHFWYWVMGIVIALGGFFMYIELAAKN